MKKDDILEEERLLSKKRMPDVIRRTRILHVKDFLEAQTDEEYSTSMADIINYLNSKEIPAERKSVIDDIHALIDYGMDIELENGKLWKLLSRDFELSEIKLIVDCIASSKFLSEEKSKQLIEKVESLVSTHQRKSLNRQLTVSGRVKSMNETVLYTIDKIHEAIENDMCLDFKYFQYNMEKKREYKHDGKTYHVAPKNLLYDNNNYYLLADEGIKLSMDDEDNFWDDKEELKTFRIDRMTNVEITEEARGEFFFARGIDTASYTKSTFGMYHGEQTDVTMLFSKGMMDTVIDKFGKDVKTEIVDDEHFRVKTKVAVSPQFYGWIFGLGQNVMIEYPLAVAKEMKDILKERHKAYREAHSGAIYMANSRD